MTRVFGVEKFKGLLLAGSFASVAEFLMGFMGSVVSGHLLGEEALSGVSIVSPILKTMMFLSALLGGGMGILYSQRMGGCDRRGAHEAFVQALWNVLILGGLLAVAMVAGRDLFLSFMAPSASVLDYARDYWNWYVPVAVLEPLTVVLLNVCYCDGDARLCFVSYVTQLAVNVLLSYVLLKAGFGTGGCAIGVLAGYAVASLVLCGHFLRKTNTFRLVAHFSWRDARRLCLVAFGDASGHIGDAVVYFFLGKLLIAHYGSGQLPVMGVVLETLGFVGISSGIASALQPIVSVYYGERNYLSIRQVMRRALALVAVEGSVMMVLFAAFPEIAMAIVGVDDPSVRVACATAVRIVALGFVADMVANVMNNYYQYVGREGISTAASAWLWVAAPLLSLAVFAGVGPAAIWFAYPVAKVVGSVLFFLYFYLLYGRESFFLMLPRFRDRLISVYSLELAEESIVTVARQVAERLREYGAASRVRMRAQLMTEEVLMTVRDRNRGRKVLAEVTLDLNDGILLTLRDDGEVFDITDADQRISSLRTFLVATVMENQQSKLNLTTTGFNRNVFRF